MLRTVGLGFLALGYTEKVIVIGAGISGLACAFRLKELGIQCLVLEAKERAGGLIATIRRGGFLFETGPQCPRFPPSVWRLVRELDLKGEFVEGDPKAKRYVVRHGRLHPAPFSPASLITTRLIGLKSKLRLLGEPFGHSQPPDHEETLAGFVERKFGAEVLENLVDPIISSIFFGNARKMGMKSAFPALVEWERQSGSVVRGAIRARKFKGNAPSSMDSGSKPGSRSASDARRGSLRVTDALPALGSFRRGMAALPEKLAEELRGMIRYQVPVTSIVAVRGRDMAPGSGWQVSLPGGEQIEAEHLVLAVPAHAASRILEISAPQLASQLKAIEYAPVSTVSLAYERSKVSNSLDGFGFMAPRCEGLRLICTFWNSSLFPGRAPEGTVVITSFAGRAREGTGAAITDEECAKTVESENARILGISGQALDRVLWNDPQALPQYNVGHAERVAEMYSILRSFPNLHLIGNFLSGRSIADCVDAASRVAEDLQSQLERRSI